MGDAYVGARTPRREDARLLTGKGRYVGAVRLPGTLHAYVLRSPIAHGRFLGCDAKAIRAVEGVIDVITPEEAAGLRLPCVSVSPGQRLTSYPVLDDTIRYAGQPLAVVVARTPEAARDAADLLDPHLDELPAVVGVERAIAEDAPAIYPELGGNVAADFTVGDEDCAAVIDGAEHVIEMTFRIGRVSPHPMEPRGVVASYDGEELSCPAPRVPCARSRTWSARSARTTGAGAASATPATSSPPAWGRRWT